MRSRQSLAVLTRALITRSMESSRGATHYLGAGKGKVLSEEECAAENVYIQRKERERLEKQKAEKEKAEKAKENADKGILKFAFMMSCSPVLVFGEAFVSILALNLQ